MDVEHRLFGEPNGFPGGHAIHVTMHIAIECRRVVCETETRFCELVAGLSVTQALACISRLTRSYRNVKRMLTLIGMYWSILANWVLNQQLTWSQKCCWVVLSWMD